MVNPDMTIVNAYLANIAMAVKSENCKHAEVLLEQLQERFQRLMNPSHLPSSVAMVSGK